MYTCSYLLQILYLRCSKRYRNLTYGDPLGHRENNSCCIPTCTEHGYTEGIECAVCHEILTAPTEVPATGHSYGDWTIIKEATCTEEGLKQRTCTVCSTMEEEIIPMTEHDWENDLPLTNNQLQLKTEVNPFIVKL